MRRVYLVEMIVTTIYKLEICILQGRLTRLVCNYKFVMISQKRYQGNKFSTEPVMCNS